MSPKPFHLAWFLNQGWGPGQWQSTWRGQMGKEWYTGKSYIDLARRLEAAGFDYLLIEDSNYTAEIYAGSRDAYLRAGYSTPKLDATVLAAAIAQHTSRLGIAATMSTTEWNPYLLARHMQSLDQISNGRAGWNIVTGGAKLSAANMGLDDRLPHAERYARADEFTELVRKLWNTWEKDALITDRATKSLVDPDKVHSIDFEGKWFKSRGPLNTPPGPQLEPVITQAGSSPAGRAFGGKHADTILAGWGTIEQNREYLQQVRATAVENGRKATDVKVLFIVSPWLGDTEQEAQASFRRAEDARRDDPTTWLASTAAVTGVDFSTFDLDTPLGSFADEIDSEHVKSAIEQFRGQSDKTLRELSVLALGRRPMIGTPEQIADRMIEMNEAVDGDGYLFELNQATQFNARMLAEVIDGLVPELQSRGVVRTEYEFERFKDNLLAY